MYLNRRVFVMFFITISPILEASLGISFQDDSLMCVKLVNLASVL